MRWLTIDTSADGFRLAIVDETVLAHHEDDVPTGLAERLAPEAAALLHAAGPVDGIAAIVGPGSFTGIRAGLALAQGLALGFGLAPIAVTAGEAIAECVATGALPAGRLLWVASHARRRRVFLETPEPLACALDALPATGPVAVAGNAANAVAAALAARGTDVRLLSLAYPPAWAIAAVARARAAGARAALAFAPLYIDAAEAKPAAFRPAPV